MSSINKGNAAKIPALPDGMPMIFPFGIPICQYRICVYYIPISAVFQQQRLEARISPKNPENKRRRADFSVFFREIFLLLLQRIFGLKLYNIHKTVKQRKAYPPLFP